MGGGNSLGAEGEARKNCGGLREKPGRTVAGRGVHVRKALVRGEATRYRTLRVRYSLRIKNHPDPKAQAMEG